MQYRAWIFLIFSGDIFLFPSVTPSCCSVPSHPMFLGKWKRGQQICCSLLIASGCFSYSETCYSEGLHAFYWRWNWKALSTEWILQWKTSICTQSIRTRMRDLWERWEVRQQFSKCCAWNQCPAVTGCWIDIGYLGTLDVEKENFHSALNMAESLLFCQWNSSKPSLCKIIYQYFIKSSLLASG